MLMCVQAHVWIYVACLVKYIWKPEIIIRYHYLSVIHFSYLFVCLFGCDFSTLFCFNRA